MIDNIEVQGLAELEKQLTKLGAEMGWPVLRVACREAMKPVKQQMQQNAPFNEDPKREEGPHMRDKISLTTRKKGSKRSKSTAAVTRVGPTKQHSQKAIAAEYGTTKQSPTPFMRNALFDNRHQVVNKFKQVLRAKLIEASQ
ncbi:HK97-gp10 family putative phage morphogenesis protein [Vibrio parahaemolyticus]|uniref:HK97-gp10 family putative phage morphogenesis protein n=1 Tax=Vibrio parahaemolyticus TaxID=670 RepID=UPI00188CAC41|nr:HK97-gp10 family putative phage morphogenesis protein [Vibrio parahaemolyticus]